MKVKILSFFITYLILVISVYSQDLEDYHLVWADEFNGTELDTTKWSYRGLGPRRDAINVRNTVSIDGKGYLILTTKKVGKKYHTAMIGTEGKFDAKFGYVECRVQMQKEVGHWSAFWLQSPTINKTGNPAKYGTEIDIYEYFINFRDTLTMNLHWNGYGKQHKHTGTKHYHPGISEGFHTIGLKWTHDRYLFYVDGKKAWQTEQAVSHTKQYIILSLEVGKWAGDISKANLPDSLIFDYVKVYQKIK